ncbi:MAG: four-helix bundle copper-binding protein [Candidatus Manganitrophaceae bacterium]|nr:MAG: four-helix bundle copper-binding protein [Candidatus Manganitrophaceae bacterium]
MPHTATHPMSKEMEQCIQNCLDCYRVCLQAVTYCLQMGGKHAAADHIRLLFDCAEICQTSASFMLRYSDLHGQTCAVCAEVCERCAESCEQFGEDALMKACSQACRRSAASCQKMAQSQGRAAA